jgi:hypothetical protein
VFGNDMYYSFKNLGYEEKCKIENLGGGSGRLCIFYVSLQQ